MGRVIFEQRFKEDEENYADIWVLGYVSSRRKTKCKASEVGKFLTLAKRPGRLENTRGSVNFRAENEEVKESNYVHDYKVSGYVFYVPLKFCSMGVTNNLTFKMDNTSF